MYVMYECMNVCMYAYLYVRNSDICMYCLRMVRCFKHVMHTVMHLVIYAYSTRIYMWNTYHFYNEIV